MARTARDDSQRLSVALAVLHNVENEIDEIRWVQDQYIKMLADESDLSRAQLKKKMLQRKVNIYLSAEEAVEHGIADIIV